jgi:hypothetical protein
VENKGMSRGDKEATLTEKFKAFHRANPHIYDKIVEIARAKKREGYSKYSMKRIFEEIRWENRGIETDGTDEYTLSNSFTSRYARLVMRQEEDLVGFFNLKPLRTPRGTLEDEGGQMNMF